MVTIEDARWLAGYLRKMVSTRPAAWAGTDLTLSQLIALHIISAKAPMTLLSLSEALGTRPPATCALVNRLVRAGLVERRPDPEDLRRVVVAVTHQSAQMIGKIDPETARRLPSGVDQHGRGRATRVDRGAERHRTTFGPLANPPDHARASAWLRFPVSTERPRR